MSKPCWSRIALVTASLAWGLVGQSAAVPSSATAAAPTLVARTRVPNAIIPQGEVRALRSGDTETVQSVLLTRHAKRVQRHIAKQEHASWGDDPSAMSYLEELDLAIGEYLRRRESDGKTMALSISFVSTPHTAHVEFAFAHALASRAGLELRSATVWRRLSLPKTYVDKNQEYILADAFKDGSAAVLAALRTPQPVGDLSDHE